MNKIDILNEFIEKDKKQDNFGVVGAKLVKDYEDIEIHYIDEEKDIFEENGSCYFYWIFKNILILKEHIVLDGKTINTKYSIVEDYDDFIENENDKETIQKLVIAQKIDTFYN